jgi:DNA polymerase-1
MPGIGGYKDLSELWIAAVDSGQPEMFDNVLETAIWQAEQHHQGFSSTDDPMRKGSDVNNPFPVYKVRGIKELRHEEGTEEGWLCPLFMRQGEISLFAGAAKESGKTTFYAHMLKAVHDGVPFMGMPTVKSGALILSEQGTNILEATTMAGIEDDDEIYFAFYKDLAKEDWPKLIADAVECCKQLGIGILVVDTLTAFAELHGSAENDAGEIRLRMKPILEATRVHGLHVSVIHHTGWNGRIRGSSDFRKDPDVIWTLKEPAGEHPPNVRALEGLGRDPSTTTKFNIALEDDGYRLLGTNAQIQRAKATNELLSKIPFGRENARRRAEILDKVDGTLDVSRKTIERALEGLVAKQDVAQEQIRGPGKPFVVWRGGLFTSHPLRIHKGSDVNKSEDQKIPAKEHISEGEYLRHPPERDVNRDVNKKEGESAKSKTAKKKELSPEEEAELRTALSAQHPEYVHTEEGAQAVLEWVRTVPWVALDIETAGKLKRDALLYTRGRVRLVQLHYGETSYLLDCDHVPDEAMVAILRSMEDKELYAHNSAFDVPRLYRRFGILLSRNVHDTLLASRVARAGEWTKKKGKVLGIEHGLEACIPRELGITIPKQKHLKWDGVLTQDHMQYAGDDVRHLRDLYEALQGVLDEHDVVERYEAVRETLPIFLKATVTGIPLDTERLQAPLDVLAGEIEDLLARLEELAPAHPEGLEWVWRNRIKDLSEAGPGRKGVLRGLSILGVDLPSSDAQTLLEHHGDHEIIPVLYDYYQKSITYSRYRKWPTDFYEDGRMFPQPRVAAAVTSRVLYADPNVQGIDKKKTQDYRKCIRATDGRAIVSGDYQQQELRIAAFFSRDKAMLEAFASSRDIYQETAKKLVGHEVDKDDPARAAAKRATLGFLYGLGPKKYAQNVLKDTGERLTEEQAHRDREAFRSAFPQFYAWQRHYGIDPSFECRSALGWRRVVAPDYQDETKPKFTDRLNAPIQSSAGDILYLTLSNLREGLEAGRYGVQFLLSVHDELVLEVDQEHQVEAAKWLKSCMRAAMETVLGPELGDEKAVEVFIGPSWGERQEIS